MQKIKLDLEGVGNEVKIVVDSDCAGCSKTRKSTHGGCIMVGDDCLKASSTTQRVMALSSGEAENYAAIKGASEALVSWQVALTWAFGPMARYHSEF